MRLLSLRSAAAAMLAAGALSMAGMAAAQERECPVPETFFTFEPALPKTARALAEGREAVIVALGGASTLGRAAGAAERGWPARMAAALAARFPSARIKMVNLGVPRQTAKEAAARLERDVLPLKPVLVIWETGTMEAVRGIDIDDFQETLQTGIDDLLSAGIEVVLMNMQFSRRTHAMINFAPYLIALREVADVNDVAVFRRHGIMRHWAETGALDLGVSGKEERRKLAVKLYDCIGRAAAEFIARKPQPESRSESRP